MRSCHSFLPLSALLVCLPLCLSPAFAQAPATPETPTPAPVATLPVPAPITAPVPLADPPVLVIPAPPGGKMRVEMDARSEDLLGMVKSFLKGIGETNASGTPKTAGQPAAPANPIADMLAGGNLAETLKDVNHVHFVVYELPAPPAPPAASLPKKVKALLPGQPPTVLPDPAPALAKFDSNAFYEDAFTREGAHRILFTDADDYKLVMVGFPDRHGYAFAVSGAGYVAVSRTDGYPNLEALSAFISQVTSSVIKSKTVKDMMDGAMNGDKTPDKSGDSGKGDDKK